jgi:hypothetical protein
MFADVDTKGRLKALIRALQYSWFTKRIPMLPSDAVISGDTPQAFGNTIVNGLSDISTN